MDSLPGYKLETAPIYKALKKWHENLPAPMLKSLLADVQSLAQSLPSQSLSVGSACSGTDISTKVLETILMFWRRNFRIGMELVSQFVCEKDPNKQRFLLQNHSPQILVADSAHLGQGSVYNLITRATVVLPYTMLFTAGFTCVSRSPLSCHRKDNKGCVERGAEATGESFAQIFAYVQASRPSIVILENVVQLMEKVIVMRQEDL